MATSPISDELKAALKNATAWRFGSSLGSVFTPRFFCCDDPNALGITEGKTPVAVISLTPNPAFVSETVTYTGTASYDPDGSITSYAWTFESHTPASGTASNGTLNYGTAGTFEIKLVVTDGTGLKSSPARTPLVVKDVGWGDAYSATSNGVYYTNDGGGTWGAKTSGLSGDDLITNDIKIDPATQHLPEASKTVWIATDGGLHVSNDGAATWVEKNPASVTDTWGDGTALSVSVLNFKKLLFVGNRLFTIANWQNGASEERSWIFYTDNAPAMRSDTSGSVTWTEIS